GPCQSCSTLAAPASRICTRARTANCPSGSRMWRCQSEDRGSATSGCSTIQRSTPRSKRASATVPFPSQYELLGKRDTRGWRRLCEHRDSLGDASGDRRRMAVGLHCYVLTVVGGDLALHSGLDPSLLQVVKK